MDLKRNKVLAFSLLLFTIVIEYLHLLFEGIYHSETIRNGERLIICWDDIIYYWTNESFTLFLVIIAYMKIGVDKGTKCIMAGICFWYLIEWVEITLQLAKINDSRLYINDGSWLQLFTCFTISVLVLLFGSKK